jgi:hypothetical protein
MNDGILIIIGFYFGAVFGFAVGVILGMFASVS